MSDISARLWEGPPSLHVTKLALGTSDVTDDAGRWFVAWRARVCTRVLS